MPCVQARAGGALVLIPLLDVVCALSLPAVAVDDPRLGFSVDWNGRALEVVVVARLLGLPAEIGPRSVALVHQRDGDALALVVDRVGAVLPISPQQHLPLPADVALPLSRALVQTSAGLSWLLRLDGVWPEGGTVHARAG